MKKPSIGVIGTACVVLVGAFTAAFISTSVLAGPVENATISVPASDDTYLRAAMSEPAGAAGALVVGGGSPAVTYVRFAVPALPPGTGPLRVSLVFVPVRLIGTTGSAVLDVHSVADTAWSEDTLTVDTAPALGPVIGTATLGPAAANLTVDVTPVVHGAGAVAFALTVALGVAQRLFVSKEGGGAAGGPRLVLTRDPSPLPTGSPSGTPPTGTPTPTPSGPPGSCVVGAKLVPTCGVLLGVAPGGHTGADRLTALISFESETGHDQAIFHTYHRGVGSMFPDPEEIAIARQTGHPRILFVNWKPQVASWGSIAAGNPLVDHYLDQLARYIETTYTEPFFFTIHHEPENDVKEFTGSGYTAEDYAAMYRHVVLRLRADGVTNLVTVMDYMAYVPWNIRPWFAALYPGDDVVDWVAWDMYGYSVPHGYGYGDFAEMLNRGSGTAGWPGIYPWAAAHFPDKPLMVAEWGVWYSAADQNHQATVFGTVATELASYPQIKALVYFDTPNSSGHDSLISTTSAALAAYRQLSAAPIFQVSMIP